MPHRPPSVVAPCAAFAVPVAVPFAVPFAVAVIVGVVVGVVASPSAEASPPSDARRAEVVWTYAGIAPGDRTGHALALAGDVDGDGRADLVVGAPGASPDDTPLVRAGAVAVVSGATGRRLVLVYGDDAGDAFGFAVAGAGDLDGDGTPDVVAGSPAGTPSAGSVRALSGASGRTLWTRTGHAAGERYGHALARVDDVDGDGCDDVLVGAPQADDRGWNAGRVELLSGASGALLRRVDGDPGTFLGMTVAGLGDLDGDGVGEHALGAPFADVGAFNAGSVRVCSGWDGATRFSVHGQAAGDRLGEGLCRTGDLDGDGVPDLAAAAPGADAGHVDAGAVEAFSGTDGRRLWVVGAGEPGVFAAAVAGVGDLDDDGCADVLFGVASAAGRAGTECGRVRAVSGRTGTVLFEREGARRRAWFGAALAAADLDGDGRPELVVGAPVHDDGPRRAGRVVALRAPAADARSGLRKR